MPTRTARFQWLVPIQSKVLAIDRRLCLEDWKHAILRHLDDGVPRTFNRIGVELSGLTADVLFSTPADPALWELVEDGLIELTLERPILFRRVRSSVPRLSAALASRPSSSAVSLLGAHPAQLQRAPGLLRLGRPSGFGHLPKGPLQKCAAAKRRVLEEVKAHDRLVADVMAGKVVLCSVCHEPLKYFGLDSGRHPGIYCGNGCTEILMTIKKDESTPTKNKG